MNKSSVKEGTKEEHWEGVCVCVCMCVYLGGRRLKGKQMLISKVRAIHSKSLTSHDVSLNPLPNFPSLSSLTS